MGLDFTALESIAQPLEIAKKTYRNPTEKPISLDENQQGVGKRALSTLGQMQAEQENARQVYEIYQDNIKRSEELTSEITKGLQRGEDPALLLLKALECISKMTGNTVLYDQNRGTIIDVYGLGLGYREPLRLELERAELRLSMLSRPELSGENTTQETRQRIQKAIRAHRELIERLERDLESSEQGA